jgi:hypothetical protein
LGGWPALRDTSNQAIASLRRAIRSRCVAFKCSTRARRVGVPRPTPSRLRSTSRVR